MYQELGWQPFNETRATRGCVFVAGFEGVDIPWVNQRETPMVLFLLLRGFFKDHTRNHGTCWILLSVSSYSSHLDCFKLGLSNWIISLSRGEIKNA